MAAVLIHIADVIDRIAATKAFRKVGGAADLAAAKNLRDLAPAAYVLPASSDAAGDLYTNETSQIVSDTFTVYMVVRNVRDAHGAAALQMLEPLRLKVMDALIGWLPPNGFSEFQFRRGRIDAFDDQCVFWRDEYSASRLIEA
ncbi:MAG: hypothetical protein LBE32_00505 [Burkholderiales bacterium]|jgi:hypothetical protein|nr:hypothetical protein [Burkholderiales bacterium]